MAIFVFIFSALLGAITALLAAMLFDVGVWGGLAVFFVTCYGSALVPFLLDRTTDADRP